ncbi:MAG: LamG-like jellyroll fold domain-containing protein, partial [Candidatus Acidiferrum sp.]
MRSHWNTYGKSRCEISSLFLIPFLLVSCFAVLLLVASRPSHVHAASTGLVAAYSFNEGSGSTVNDSSGNGNNGTVSGATWTTTGKYGGALSFNGKSSRVVVNDSASLHLSSGMTLEAWVSPTNVPNSWEDVIYKQNDIYFLEAGSGVSKNPPAIGATFASHGDQYIAGLTALSANTWTHLAATYDGSTLLLYVNGVQVVSRSISSDSVSISTNALQIGGDALYGQYFKGIIDEVRIYNRALAPSEIQNDMVTPISQTVDTQPPTAPSNLSGTSAGPTSINLSWTASTDNVGVTNYLLERCAGSGCSSFSQIATPTGTSYSDSGLAASTSYSYRVRATDAAGNLSGYSNVATVVTASAPDTAPPTAPTNLTATPISTSQINLSWTASTDNVGVTNYLVERCLGSGCISFSQVATPAGTTYSDTGLAASTSYSYRVRATDAAGNLSAYSNVSTAVTMAAATAAYAPISFVQASYATPQTSQTSVSVLYSAAQIAGDLNVVVVGWNNTSATVASVTDSSGNAYSLAIGPTKISGSITQSIYYAKNVAAAAAKANTVTIAFSGSAAAPDIRILEYSGLDPVSPFDVAAGGTGSSNSSASPSATTTNSNDLIFGANIVVSMTTGPGSGFTQRVLTSPDGDIAEDKAISATGTYSASAPLGSSAAWIMQMVAFKAAQLGSSSGTESVPPPPALVSIALSPSSATITTGATESFTATGTLSNNTTENLTSLVTWSSSNISVATIGANTGLATGLSAGTSQVSASFGGLVSTTVTLTVNAAGGGGGGSAVAALVQHVSSSNTRNNSFSSPYCYHFQLPNFTTAGNAVV